ncbi:MAG: winged helix-turn-helix domain-containing protein, partial [SAR202 cluster bacterium]|nr:winged helix-turn-helix domain-containing protein [SAR202 cluster bacterium]
MVANRRSSIDIVADILRLGESNKTRVMYQVNMSHAQLESYLIFLIDRNLIEQKTDPVGKSVYSPTEQGQVLLQHIERVQLMMGSDS